jgi:hypothetical protein
MLRLLPIVILVAGATGAAHAEPAGTSPMDVPPQAREGLHVWNAGERDRTCLRWSDGCVACSRDGGCNNIGIVCQPGTEIRCLERRQLDDKTPEEKTPENKAPEQRAPQ